MAIFGKRDKRTVFRTTRDVARSRETELPPGDVVEILATDGPMPATRDAFEALKARGRAEVDVDLVNTAERDSELLELIELEIHHLASEHGLTVRSIVHR